MIEHLSIVIPLLNEEDSLPKLLQDIHSSMESSDINYEIILVDDFSDIKVSDVVEESSSLTIIRNDQNLGQSKSLFKGISAARYDYICTLDGDGQNPPSEVRKLVNKWLELKKENGRSLLICGNRIKRKDNFVKKVSSKFANSLRKQILNDNCNDTACALKALEKKDYINLEYFKNMHRFLPALFILRDIKVINIPVVDRPRILGKSKFNFHNRFWVGMIDLIKVWNLIRKGRELK